MAKTSGLGAIVAVDDASDTQQTITNDVTEFQMSTPVALQDITGVDKSAHERLALLRDASFSLKGVFNTASNMSHAVFSTVTSTATNRGTSIKPIGGSSPVLACELLFKDYSITRSNAGDLVWSVSGDLADGTVPTWA